MIRRSAFILVVCLVATSMFAQAVTKTPDGVQAAVDERGQLRQPTPEEAQALAAAASQAHQQRVLVPRVNADGAVSIALDESFDFLFVVRTDDDGNFVFNCTDDHSEAAAFVASSASVDTILRINGAPQQPRRTRIAERE